MFRSQVNSAQHFQCYRIVSFVLKKFYYHYCCYYYCYCYRYCYYFYFYCCCLNLFFITSILRMKNSNVEGSKADEKV